MDGVGHGAHAGAVTSKEENHTFDGYQSKSGWQDSVKGQCEANNTSDHIMTTQLNQNGSTDKTKTELDNDISVNSHPSSERRGRAEWRRYELPSRSKSFDCRAGKRSPNQDKSHDLFALSSIRGGGIGKHSEYLGERRAEWEGERGRVRSSVQLFNFTRTTNDDKDMSQLSHVSQTLNRGDGGNSLPFRWRSLSGPGADIIGTAAAPGPKGSQSILERIEKLYGSAGFSKTEDNSKSQDCSKAVLSHHKETASDFSVPLRMSHDWATGATFPRRFSSGSTNSPETKTRPFTWTQNYTSEKSLLRTTRTEERLLREQWQGQTEDRFSEDRGLHQGAASENFGTMSLDRVRSKHSIGAQLRSARAAGESAIPPPPNSSLQKEDPPSWRDSLRLSEEGGAGSKANKENVETDEPKRTLRGRMGDFKEGVEQKKPDDGTKAVFKCSPDDVFELNPQKATTKANELKKVPEFMSVSSTDSVKNRINQFEALTQRFQDVAPGQSPPRRTFSVPTQISRTQSGVQKSWSAKALGGPKDRSERLKEAGEAKEMFSKGKAGSARSLSVDEVVLRLEEKEQNDSDHGGNSQTEHFQTYSRFKNTLEIPLKRENKGPLGGFSIDETDFTKIPSPDEARKRPTYLLSTCSDTGGQRTSPSPAEGKTPTNTPTSSPKLSPTSQPERPTVTHRETETASRDAAKSPRQDPPLLHGPPRNKNASPISADVDAGLPYRSKHSVLDMDAWLSGLKSEINVWNDRGNSEDDGDDDDASTQKDEDSNYDSDSGESSVTITTNMSQSEQKSFSVRWVAAQLPRCTSSFPRMLILLLCSLSDLCNFAGVDFESESDDDWQVNTRRSASLSSDMSAFSCVSVLPSEELDKLLEDVRSLGDSNLQVFLYFYCFLQCTYALKTSEL